MTRTGQRKDSTILTPSDSVELRLANDWKSSDNILYRGHFFIDGVLDDVSQISKASSIEEILDILRRVEGFFSFIIADQGKLLMCVDHVRSIPVYYRMTDRGILVADDPRLISDSRKDKVSTDAALEFLCLGYVLGGDTLMEGVKQVEAGTCLVSKDGAVKKEPFPFRPGVKQIVSPETYYDAFIDTLREDFRRLREVVRGRQIALPLSGGIDSRLIALCLKKFEFENVITFTYGRLGNPDPVTSEIVAKSLGLDWHYVPYSNEMWKKVSRSKAWSDYCSYAFQFSSVPHPQDFPAIESLVADGIIEEGATVIPGHRPCGAEGAKFVLDMNGMVTKEAICEEFMRSYYQLFRIDPGSPLYRKFLSKLYDSLNLESPVPANVAPLVKEAWHMRERQSKFLVHSMRCYEHFGLNWWLPLLDSGFLKFWESISFGCRENNCYARSGKRLMKELVGDDRLINSLCWTHGGAQRVVVESVRPLMATLGRFPFLDAFRRRPLVNNFLCQLGAYRNRDYESSFQSLFGLVDKKEFMKIYTGIETKNSFIALDMVRDLIDPSLLSPSEEEYFSSIVLFKSNMLKYLESYSRRARRGNPGHITRQMAQTSSPRGETET